MYKPILYGLWFIVVVLGICGIANIQSGGAFFLIIAGLSLAGVIALPWIRESIERTQAPPLPTVQTIPPPGQQVAQSSSPGLTSTQGGLFIPQSEETEE